eukprot:2837821-Pyramimonas_sp.AAC.1
MVDQVRAGPRPARQVGSPSAARLKDRLLVAHRGPATFKYSVWRFWSSRGPMPTTSVPCVRAC